MATHNQTISTGYIKNDPQIWGDPGSEKFICQIRTTHRPTDGYYEKKYEDLLVYYDGEELMPKLKKLKKFDVIEIKGVFNVLILNKKSICPVCQHENIKYNGTATYIYPIDVLKLNSLTTSNEWDSTSLEGIISKHYEEWSNNLFLIGTLVKDPEMVGSEKHPCCRYMLGIDRKYFIKTQSDITADYPWVYSYGQQATWDFMHLKKGSVVAIDGFIENRNCLPKIKCEHCQKEYEYDDVITSFIPYSVEYLSNYITDEEIAAFTENNQ